MCVLFVCALFAPSSGRCRWLMRCLHVHVHLYSIGWRIRIANTHTWAHTHIQENTDFALGTIIDYSMCICIVGWWSKGQYFDGVYGMWTRMRVRVPRCMRAMCTCAEIRAAGWLTDWLVCVFLEKGPVHRRDDISRSVAIATCTSSKTPSDIMFGIKTTAHARRVADLLYNLLHYTHNACVPFSNVRACDAMPVLRFTVLRILQYMMCVCVCDYVLSGNSIAVEPSDAHTKGLYFPYAHIQTARNRWRISSGAHASDADDDDDDGTKWGASHMMQLGNSGFAIPERKPHRTFFSLDPGRYRISARIWRERKTWTVAVCGFDCAD